MNKAILTVGTEIYYAGDMANEPKFGIIAAVLEDKMYGTHLEVIYDDGTTTRLSPCQFDDEYLGHAGTRFVTKAAYLAYREAAMAKFYK